MIINRVGFTPNLSSKFAFKASSQEISEKARLADKGNSYTGDDFVLDYEDENPKKLRDAARLIKNSGNNDPMAVKLLEELAES